ncbi:YkvA family protein [Halalkalibacter alkalisediminis]|uniref:YkvA family protein n=1 Tax=Halalkalibacter alkalisediminis TaxID=935616 RepID=A0ABV6NCG7_9BACI|nr:DUF1232 domain-containing protein [Halalkalibacter alkalisediminis]
MLRFFKRLTFIFKFWKFIPFLVDFFSSKEVQVQKKILGVSLIVAYAVFPFDLIPDFISFFGILDDVMLATFILTRIVKIAPQSLKIKHQLPT